MSLQRVKLNKLKSYLSVDEIEYILNSHPYNNSTEFGFSVEERSNDRLRCVFSELVRVAEEVLDPNGNVVHQEFFNFYYVDFYIDLLDEGKYIIYILNPSRTLKSFVSKLSFIFDFNVYFSSFDVDLKEVIDLFNNDLNSSLLRVSKVKASGFVLNENSKATIEITSKKNALEDIASIFKSKDFTLDRATFSIYFDNVKVDFDMSKKGTLISSEYGINLILKMYKEKNSNLVCF